LHADLRQDQVTAEALDLVVLERRQCGRDAGGPAAARDRRNDAERVAVAQRRRLLLEIADVVVVDVDVDEVPQPALLVVQVALQIRVLRRERGQHLPDGAALDLDAVLLPGEGPQGRRDVYDVSHNDLLTRVRATAPRQTASCRRR